MDFALSLHGFLRKIWKIIRKFWFNTVFTGQLPVKNKKAPLRGLFLVSTSAA
jgi:hypothetical protein